MSCQRLSHLAAELARRVLFPRVAAQATIIAMLLCTPTAGAAPATANAAPSPAGQAAWQTLFADATAAASQAKQQAFLQAIGSDTARLRALIAADTAYPAWKPGIHERSLRFRAGESEYKVDFVVRIPAGYTPAKSWPLLVAAHGKGGRGLWMTHSFQTLLGRDIERFLIVAPTMPGPPGWKAELYQQLAYLEPLARARRNLNVDDDRITLAGYSQGGHLTWQLSTFHPRLFAATVPMAGAPTAEGFPFTTTTYLQNLEHLRLWAVWGELDGPKGPQEGIVDFCRRTFAKIKTLRYAGVTGTELAGKKHGECWPDKQSFLRVVDPARRPAPPSKYYHVFHMPYHARSYYVEALAYSRPPMDMRKKQPVYLKPGVAPTNANLIEATRRLYASRLYRLRVTTDTKHNVIRILPTAITKVRVYLVDGLLDLSKPVVLSFAGRTWRGRVKASAACLLHHYAQTRDATRLILNEIDIDNHGKATVRYK